MHFLRTPFSAIFLLLCSSILQAQDKCVDATEIKLVFEQNTQCGVDFYRGEVKVDLAGSTASSAITPTPSCGGYGSGKNDVWYKVEVPAGIKELNFVSSNHKPCPLICDKQPAIHIYRGGSCNNLSGLRCLESFAGFPPLPIPPPVAGVSGNVKDLIPGETLWIRTWDKNNDALSFTLTVKSNSGLPNDDCSNPLPLSYNGCNIGAGGDDFAPVGGTNNCGWSSTDNSVFYTFKVTSSTPQPVKINLENVTCTGGGQELQLAIYDKLSDCKSISGNGSSHPSYHGCARGTGTVTITATPNPLPPGEYLLAVDGYSGADCHWSFSGAVVTPLPEADFNSSDTLICPNQCINFIDNTKNISSKAVWQWKFQGATPGNSTEQDPSNICFANDGSYDITLVVSDTNGTDSITKQIVVDRTKCPLTVNATVSKDTVCPGECVDIKAVAYGGSGSGYGYTWNNDVTGGEGPHKVCINDSITYSVVVTDDQGNKDTAKIAVYVNTSVEIDVIVDHIVCDDDSASGAIDITILSGIDPYLFFWTDGPTDEDRSGLIPGSYELTLLDGNFCVLDTIFIVDSLPCPPPEKMVVPNVFTPNGDGVNDAFVIDNLPPGSGITIYNRWGRVLLKHEIYNNNWKGEWTSGTQFPDGVYFYVLSLPEGEEKSGFVTILRN